MASERVLNIVTDIIAPLPTDNDAGIEAALEEAFFQASTHRPVLVDVAIDYSKLTRFTEGIVRTNLERFDFGTKARFIGRALWRRVIR